MRKYFKLKRKGYPGGKGSAGVAQQIINQLPQHDVFFVGMLGCCRVTQMKEPAALTVGYDTDADRVNDWQNAAARFAESNDCKGRKARFICADSTRLADSWLLHPTTVAYFDPPYLPSVIKSDFRYDTHMTEREHEDYLHRVKELPCRVAISHYPCELYDKIFKTWRRITYTTTTRRGGRTEALYMNYPEPLYLHDYDYYGNDKREREGYNRAKQNMIRKLHSFDSHTREMMLREIARHFPRVSGGDEVMPILTDLQSRNYRMVDDAAGLMRY